MSSAVFGADKNMQVTSNFGDGLGDHRSQGRHTKHYAGSEQAVEHQGFEFHGGFPLDG
jgi:hypothetical protein